MLLLLLINLMTVTNLSLPIQTIASFWIVFRRGWILNPYCIYLRQKHHLEIVVDFWNFIFHFHHESLTRAYCSCVNIIVESLGHYLLINKMVMIYFWIVSMIVIVCCNVENWPDLLYAVMHHSDDDNFNYYTMS